MTDVLQGPFRAVAADGGNSGNNGNREEPELGALPDDAYLSGVALDVLGHVLGWVDGDGDEAARVLLLAAAEVLHDGPTAARPGPASDMLMKAVGEALDAFHAPPPAVPTNVSGEPLRVPAGTGEFVRRALKGFAPSTRTDDEAPPPRAA